MAEQTRKILFCVCGGFFLVALIFTIVCLADSYHIIKEGSVGIYYIQGRLQETLAKPGKLAIIRAPFGCNNFIIFHFIFGTLIIFSLHLHRVYLNKFLFFRRELGPTIYNGSGGNHYKTKNWQTRRREYCYKRRNYQCFPLHNSHQWCARQSNYSIDQKVWHKLQKDSGVWSD